jgi:hypothetical protein
MIALKGSVDVYQLLQDRVSRHIALLDEAEKFCQAEGTRLRRSARSRGAYRPGPAGKLSVECDFCSKSSLFQISTKIAGEPCSFCCVRCLASFENDDGEPVDPCTYCSPASLFVRPR